MKVFLRHFSEISKLKFPYIGPIIHPGRCGIELDVTTLIKLSKFENLVGIKECSKNNSRTRELLEKSPDTIILAGDDDRAISMIQRGAKGSISVIANLMPGYWKKVISLSLEGI